MMRRAYEFAILVLAVLAPSPARAQAATQDDALWIHVEVFEAGEKGANVKVNLPLSLIDVALDLAPDDVIADGRLKIDSSDVSVADMRRMWSQLRTAGDAEFITVEEEDETVRIARQGEIIEVHVTDRSNGTEKTRIEVPLSIVDALFAGEGDALDVRGALAQLKTRRGEILSVDDGESRVRIWIDERSAPRS